MSEIDIAILDACGFQPEKYEKLIKKLQTSSFCSPRFRQNDDQNQYLPRTSCL